MQALTAAQAIAARLSASASGGALPSAPIPSSVATASAQPSSEPTERRRAPPEPAAASYNQQPFQYPTQPGAVVSSVPLDSAAAQSSIAKAQQAASALFARFQQQNFPQANGGQPPSQAPASRGKWDAR